MNSILRRRRAAMLQNSEPPLPPNKFLEGAITKGESSLSVDADGNVTISAWKSGSSNRPSIPMVRAIDFVTGDTVRLVVTKLSGSISASFFCEIWVNSLKVADNKSWGTGTTAIDQSVTAAADAGSVYFTMNTKSNAITFSSYKFAVEVYVNGVKKFPEV